MANSCDDEWAPTVENLVAAVRELAEEGKGHTERRKACKAYGRGLAEVGQVLWITGTLEGPDRATGESSFGDDDVVGLATICQIGGELARGVIDLLDLGNQYAAHALVRQLVEVEYLVAAFANEDQIARDWIRADRKTRMKFWSPAELRRRANGKFLREDYWEHCDRGGHPTREALPILPDHEELPIALAWADLSGHLFSVWAHVVHALDVRHDRVPSDTFADTFKRVAMKQVAWLESDDLTLVLRAAHAKRREELSSDPK